jgi:phosphoglycerol transferase MdoB-like AlkP superfamily enzyme
MAARLKFLFLYFISWILLFDLMRLVFLFYHAGKTKQLSFPTILSSFWYGLRIDASMAAYIIAPVFLFVLASLVIRFFQKALVYKVYTCIVLFFVTLLSLADLEAYTAWGFRIDNTPLKYLNSPKEAMASISHLPLFLITVVFIVCYIAFCFSFNWVIKKIFFKGQVQQKILPALVLLILMGSLIIPIRGGFQLAPINQSSVYFSSNNYANHAAINATWNFLHSLWSSGSSGKNPYEYFTDVKQVKRITDSLYTGQSSFDTLINFSNTEPTNVIMVVWESFTEKATTMSFEGKEITPWFNKLKAEGIYFSNVYASGDRTDKGIPAILSGYPALPKTSIIHSPNKSARIKVLSQLFAERGYQTPFFYGGEPEFANIKSYLLHAGFNPIVGKNDFSSKDMNSKWGAHDGVVAKKVLADLNVMKQPFFATWLTLSSHEPFEVPVNSIFNDKGRTANFLNSHHYTDEVVGNFIQQCSKQPWWKNTVMIITGDHGHAMPETGKKADDFRTPLLWIGGAIRQQGVVIERVISQLDIAAILSHQAGLDTKVFPFSKNSIDKTVKPWAFFTFNDGFGFVDSLGRLVFDNVGKRPVLQEGNSGTVQTEAGKAMMQLVYDDFLKK